MPDRDRAEMLTLRRLLETVADHDRPVELAIETKHPTRYAGLVERRLVELLAQFGLGAPRLGTASPVRVMSFSQLSPAPDAPAGAAACRRSTSWSAVPLRFRDGTLPPGVRIAGPEHRDGPGPSPVRRARRSAGATRCTSGPSTTAPTSRCASTWAWTPSSPTGRGAVLDTLGRSPVGESSDRVFARFDPGVTGHGHRSRSVTATGEGASRHANAQTGRCRQLSSVTRVRTRAAASAPPATRWSTTWTPRRAGMPMRDEAEMVLSELVTNADPARPPLPDGNISVCWTVQRRPSRGRGDRRRRRQHPAAAAAAAVSSLGGRGLRIVRTICTSGASPRTATRSPCGPTSPLRAGLTAADRVTSLLRVT